MENTEWVWLKNEGTDGLWEAPASVVKAMADQGWYPTDERPVVVDPTKAEMPREWFVTAAPAPAKKSSKRASASTEGTDSDG